MKESLSIFLRGFQEEDYKIINKWRNDPEIQKLVSTSFKYVSEAIEREWVKKKMMDNHNDIYLAICLKENDQMIGYTSINNIDYINRSAFAGGIVIDPAYQTGVYRYEAGLLSRELVFDHLNLNRLVGKCLAEHKVTRITIEACGFKLEGVFRKAIYKNGQYHDQYVYSLLRDEYYKMVENGEYSLKSYIHRVKKLKKDYFFNTSN